MNFSHALEYLKQGKHLFRKGWNGRHQFIVLQKGWPQGIPINKQTAEALHLPEKTICRFRPYIMLRSSKGDFGPWAPSNTDILENDWVLLEADDD